MSKRIVKSAGCVVCRYTSAEEIGVLLIGGTPSEPDYWGFPKGKQEPGEIIEATAVREVLEETGIRVELLALVGFTEYTFTNPNEEIRHKLVRFYLAIPIGLETVGCGIEHQEAKWLPIDQAHRRLTYDDDREVLSCARKLIEQHLLFQNILKNHYNG